MTCCKSRCWLQGSLGVQLPALGSMHMHSACLKNVEDTCKVISKNNFNCKLRQNKKKANLVKTRTRLQQHPRLACLEIRSRNEEAINSTRSLKVFDFLLYRRRQFLFVSELIQQACQRRPKILLCSLAILVYKYTKIQGLDSREITSLPEIENVIYMACHFNHRRKLLRFSQTCEL